MKNDDPKENTAARRSSPKRRLLRRLGAALAAAGVLAVSVLSFSACSTLGELPEGERLSRIEQSPHYRDGAFVNEESTSVNTSESSTLANWWNFLFANPPRLRPSVPLSRAPLDVAALKNETADFVIWMGHSSLFVQTGGRRILVDPVFAGFAAPLSLFNQAFDGPLPYSIEDFIKLGLDLVLITHDHYDHLEMQTIKALADTDVTFVVPLGIGQHLESWGVRPEQILEGDWGESFELFAHSGAETPAAAAAETEHTNGPLKVSLVTARHFSGRFLTADKTLWAGFVLTCADGSQIYISGDSGYGRHFKEIAAAFPRIKLALIECGQYNPNWSLIHMSPEETAKAVDDLQAPQAIALHSGRFALSLHPWDEPYLRLDKAAAQYSFELLTPRMDELVYLDGREQHFERWWLKDAQRELAQEKQP